MALKIPAALIGGSASETTDISNLKTAVGDANSGLVKAVADLQTAVGDANSGLVKDVAALKTTVGDATSGLVKAVADLQAAATPEQQTEP